MADSVVEPPVLRPAGPADLAAAARIWHEGWWDGHQSLAERLGPWRTPESFVERLRPRLGSTTVAELKGEMLGFSVVIGDELEQLYVDRRARGSGVARDLIQHAERQVQAGGHAAIWLAVAAGNHVAQRFYRKVGWQDLGTFEYPAETATGHEPVTCHRYERRFA